MRALLLVVLLAGTAAAQPARAPAASANDRAVSEALAGFDVASDGAAWDAVPAAFEALYPGTRYAQTRLTRVQARAIAFTAVTLAASARGRVVPSQPGYPAPGYPAPGPSAQTPRERALDLAFRFLAVVPSGASISAGPERSALVAQGAEAAGAAGAAGCTGLGSALTALTARIRTSGFVFSNDVATAQGTADACR